ncbi:MAG TPA: VOC family protein [Bryobacteraceae bacterium]|nr:VOC family protein [Bryobacteraceae bacterium]
MKINGIAETALYVADVHRSAEFYQRLFHLPRLLGDDDLCALGVPGNAVLLFFRKGSRPEPLETPGGTIPPHGGSGSMHFAMKISADAIGQCVDELQQHGIAIESTVHWPQGGTSLYFRDPDQHLVELITPGVWEVY